jgi:hypothetical protein
MIGFVAFKEKRKVQNKSSVIWWMKVVLFSILLTSPSKAYIGV